MPRFDDIPEELQIWIAQYVPCARTMQQLVFLCNKTLAEPWKRWVDRQVALHLPRLVAFTSVLDAVPTDASPEFTRHFTVQWLYCHVCKDAVSPAVNAPWRHGVGAIGLYDVVRANREGRAVRLQGSGPLDAVYMGILESLTYAATRVSLEAHCFAYYNVSRLLCLMRIPSGSLPWSTRSLRVLEHLFERVLPVTMGLRRLEYPTDARLSFAAVRRSTHATFVEYAQDYAELERFLLYSAFLRCEPRLLSYNSNDLQTAMNAFDKQLATCLRDMDEHFRSIAYTTMRPRNRGCFSRTFPLNLFSRCATLS
jgi:hypothetical protein